MYIPCSILGILTTGRQQQPGRVCVDKWCPDVTGLIGQHRSGVPGLLFILGPLTSTRGLNCLHVQLDASVKT